MEQQQFSTPQIASVTAITIASGLMPILQPILLGGLLDTGRLTAAQMGQAATVEALGTMVSAVLATAFLKPIRLRLIVILAALVLVAANAVSIFAGSTGIILARGVNGLASGALIWLLIGLLTRVATPGRMYAIYMTAYAAGAFALTTLFGKWLAPSFGVNFCYGVLSAIGFAMVLGAALIPKQYSVIVAAGGAKVPTVKGAIGLVAVAAHFGACLGLWIYLGKLGQELGRSADTVTSGMSAATAAWIVAGLAAGALATRLKGFAGCIISAAGAAAAIGLLLTGGSDIIFYIGAVVFAFFWMFAPPYQLPMLMDLDPTHRSAMYLITAQLVGVSVGPMVASKMVTSTSFIGAASASLSLFGLCALALVIGALATSRTAAAAAAAG